MGLFGPSKKEQAARARRHRERLAEDERTFKARRAAERRARDAERLRGLGLRGR